tara:strand:+ start:53 stop:403 length:351 start_codon:yes stop_codon:yes gene_type:complete
MGKTGKSKNVSPLRYAKHKAVERHLVQGQDQLKKEMLEAQFKYGKGSRRSHEATKKYKDYLKENQFVKDLDLISEYGADAMKARGFGTTYPKVKRNGGGQVSPGEAYVDSFYGPIV